MRVGTSSRLVLRFDIHKESSKEQKVDRRVENEDFEQYAMRQKDRTAIDVEFLRLSHQNELPDSVPASTKQEDPHWVHGFRLTGH